MPSKLNIHDQTDKRAHDSKVQGEGDYVSAEKYNEETRAFVKSGKVERAARDAAPRNDQEKAEMQKAEAEGRSHAKGKGKNTAAREGSAGKSEPPEKQKPVPEKFPGR